MPEEEIIVDDSPEPLYLPIRLRSSHPGVFVDNGKLREHDFETVEMPGRLVMGREFETVVGEEFPYGNPLGKKPLVGPFHEGREGFGLLVRQHLRVGDPRGIVDDSCPVLLFLRILSFDVLLLVDVDMHEFPRHGLFVADDPGYPPQGFQELFLGFGIFPETVAEVCLHGAVMYREISVLPPCDDLPGYIVVYPVEGGEFRVAGFFPLSFGELHFFLILRVYLLSDQRGQLCQAVHVGKWLWEIKFLFAYEFYS